MKRFELCGPLPVAGTTTVLEASAGTGKTFTLAGLVTRYVAEGTATLDEMLLITFGRSATQELRERVREALQDAVRAIGDRASAKGNELLEYLIDTDEEELGRREERLKDALAGFDAATIATVVTAAAGALGAFVAGIGGGTMLGAPHRAARVKQYKKI